MGRQKPFDLPSESSHPAAPNWASSTPPAAEDQAMGRAHRIGRQRPVTVYRLVTAGSIEERIVALYHDKRSMADDILEGQDQGALMGADELGALRVAGQGGFLHACVAAAPYPSLLRSNGRPTRGSGYFQDVSAESK